MCYVVGTKIKVCFNVLCPPTKTIMMLVSMYTHVIRFDLFYYCIYLHNYFVIHYGTIFYSLHMVLVSFGQVEGTSVICVQLLPSQVLIFLGYGKDRLDQCQSSVAGSLVSQWV